VSALAIIDVPSNLGLRPSGVEQLPSALERAGLASRLRARRAGRVEPTARTLVPRAAVLRGRGLVVAVDSSRLSRLLWAVVTAGALRPGVLHATRPSRPTELKSGDPWRTRSELACLIR
jgi:arginase